MSLLESAYVVSVCISGTNTFSKYPQESIALIDGLGVEVDARWLNTAQELPLTQTNQILDKYTASTRNYKMS
jgi:hypothetical protein